MVVFVRKGQLAKTLNIPWPTVKYYTKVGLFPIARKTPNGQHLYHLEEIRERYERVKDLKRQRHTIEEIMDLLKMETIVSQAG
ncbi:MAG: MerR family transcriptional regulator [Candidatus Omnitrophica bacterium]|nr:MerR family transcriptional regulator [Candidatus Omnitrophota bacterium]